MDTTNLGGVRSLVHSAAQFNGNRWNMATRAFATPRSDPSKLPEVSNVNGSSEPPSPLRRHVVQGGNNGLHL